MPRKCNVFDCRGNYDNTPFFLSVSASRLKYLKDPRRWIDTTPNNHESLGKLKEIHICYDHFDCNHITLHGGGNRQTQSPSIFCGIPNSYLSSHQQQQDELRQSQPKHGQQNKNTTKISQIKSKILKILQNRLPRGANSTLFTRRKRIVFFR